MLNKLFFLILFFNSILTFGNKINVDNVESIDSGLGEKTVIIPEDGNVLKYLTFNLFDNELKTALALKEVKFEQEFIEAFYNLNTAKSAILLKFKKPFLINQLNIYNGFQKSELLYFNNSRPKNIKIYLSNSKLKNIAFKNVKYKGKQEKVREWILNKDFDLVDKMALQIIHLGDNYLVDTVIIAVLDVYQGNKYQDICISELEFWNNGQKYEISNLEEAKKEYIKKRIASAIPEPILAKEIKNMSEPMKAALQKNKILPENLCAVEYRYFSFDAKTPYSKEKYMGYFDGYSCEYFNQIFKSEDFTKKSYSGDIRGIGRWKIDEYGNFWVKVGGNPWKISKESGNRELFFQNTDLEFESDKFFYRDPTSVTNEN